MPPRPKSGHSQKRARAEPSSKEQTGPDGFSLAKVQAHVFLGIPEGAYISNIPSAAYALARGSTLPADAALIDHLQLESAFITGLSAGVQSLQYQASLYTKLNKAQEDAKYSTDKLLGAEVEVWLEKCHEQNEDADRLREEVERCRTFESEVVRLRGEKDEEIAWLRVELEVSKEEAKWPGEEEAEEEERLAKMLAEAEADKEDGSKDEGAADKEVKVVQPDSGDR
ncbi:hypothetical protein O6P43_002355 [Quillaja saponaria]|uniref:Uncharacterized protein n=1 Tax=Quillaja saponaria TaxID=32244 RepID=A0AAD7QCA9_QUISA|nr:hypothetical protein O6P43_002355 [Quillaja saponaria]